MASLLRGFLILSYLLLIACAEQPVEKKPAPTTTKTIASAPETVAAAPTATSTPTLNNVRLSEESSNSMDGAYYVQNRVLSSGGVISGAIMGS